MEIVPLYDHPEYIDLIAGWTHEEFCVADRPSVTLKDVQNKLHAQKPGELPCTYIAVVDGTVVGTVAMYENDLKGENVTPWLGSLFVHPEWRGQKIGKALMEFIKGKAVESGYDTLYLRTEHTGRYYDVLGWQIVKKTVDPVYDLNTTMYSASLESWKPYRVDPVIGDRWMSYILSDVKSGTSATIAVERGGILTQLFAAGCEVMYLEEDTLADEKKSVRGGCPILFPSCGRLADKRYTYQGKSYAMDIHGIARNCKWQVKDFCEDGKAQLKIQLTPSAETKKIFPFDFLLTYTYTLCGDTMSVHQEIKNTSKVRMPYSSGLHPYFCIDRTHARVKLDATEYLDVNDGFSKHGYDGVTSFDQDVECIAQKLSSTRAVLDTGLGHKILMNCTGDYRYFVLWSPEGKRFACVEPWTACPDALNTQLDLQWLEPGAHAEYVMSITALRGSGF